MLDRSADNRYDVKFTCLDDLVPSDHLLRKIDRVVDFSEIYKMVSQYYCEDSGRPSVDPVVLVKIALIQHLYGIRPLRQTVREIDKNIAYRWFIGYDIDRPIPHFATVSYAFATRFPSEFFQEIFAWILETAVSRGFVKPEAVFIDATHIKANANKKNRRKQLAKKTARVYDEQLRTEINADRENMGKPPFDDDDYSNPPSQKEVTVSTTDPESGLFRKGEHKVGAYKTPHICKKVFDDGGVLSSAYKRPMTRKGGHEWWKYVYDEHNDCVICPEYKTLYYSTTNRDGYREYKGLA